MEQLTLSTSCPRVHTTSRQEHHGGQYGDMVSVSTRLVFLPAFERYTSSENVGMVRLSRQIERALEGNTKRLAPVDEGILRASVHTERFAGPSVLLLRTSVRVRYGIYQALGTGIYGPRHRRVRPVTAKALRFAPKAPGPLVRGVRRPRRGSRAVVYAASVRGTPPNRYQIVALELSVPGAHIDVFV
jgi:hypothetical protein